MNFIETGFLASGNQLPLVVSPNSAGDITRMGCEQPGVRRNAVGALRGHTLPRLPDRYSRSFSTTVSRSFYGTAGIRRAFVAPHTG